MHFRFEGNVGTKPCGRYAVHNAFALLHQRLQLFILKDVPVIEMRQKLMQVFHSGGPEAFWRSVGSVQLVGQIGYQIDKLHSQRLFGFLTCLRHEFLELGHFLLIQRGREYS